MRQELFHSQATVSVFLVVAAVSAALRLLRSLAVSAREPRCAPQVRGTRQGSRARALTVSSLCISNKSETRKSIMRALVSVPQERGITLAVDVQSTGIQNRNVK